MCWIISTLQDRRFQQRVPPTSTLMLQPITHDCCIVHWLGLKGTGISTAELVVTEQHWHHCRVLHLYKTGVAFRAIVSQTDNT